MFYGRRRRVIQDIRRHVADGTAKDEREAIDQLEQPSLTYSRSSSATDGELWYHH